MAAVGDDGQFCAWLGFETVYERVDRKAGVALLFSVGLAHGNGFVRLIFSGNAARGTAMAMAAVPVFRAEGWNGDGDGDNSLSQLCGLDGESEDIGPVDGLVAGADAGADGDGGLVLFSAGLEGRGGKRSGSASTDLDDSARQFVGADTVTASLIGAVVL